MRVVAGDLSANYDVNVTQRHVSYCMQASRPNMQKQKTTKKNTRITSITLTKKHGNLMGKYISIRTTLWPCGQSIRYVCLSVCLSVWTITFEINLC